MTSHHIEDSLIDRDKNPKRDGQVKSRLLATGYSPLQNVYCETHEDVLILSGVVPTYYMKQMAQTIAGNMEGVKRIENQLEVRSPR